MNTNTRVVLAPIWLLEVLLKPLAGLLAGTPTYNCARIHTGTYLAGDGMGAGIPVSCFYKVIKGHVATKHLHPIRVQNGDHDSTISCLSTQVLYPRTDEAIIEIHKEAQSTKSNQKLRLIKPKQGQRSIMFKERLYR